MNRNLINIQFVYLTLLCIVLSLSACNSKGEGKDTGDVTGNANMISIIENGQTEYSVIRSSKSTAGEASVASILFTTLKSKYGVNIRYTDDWTKDTGSDGLVSNDTKEILIGNTNRAETQRVKSELPSASDWAVRLVGSKIVIYGGNEYSLKNAINYFISSFVSDDKLAVPENLNYLYVFTQQNGAASELFNNFTIVIGDSAGPRVKSATSTMKKTLEDAGGKSLKYTTDKTPDAGKEILIGDTNRPETAALKAQFSTPMDYAIQIINNKVVIAGGCAPATQNAVNAFTEQFLNGTISTFGSEYFYKFSFPTQYFNPLIYDASGFVPVWLAEWQPKSWMLDFREKLFAITNPKGRLMCLSHRGDMVNYPENSIEAYLSAIKAGADALELDTRLTKDNVLIMMHDDTLVRTTNWDAVSGKNGLPVSKYVYDWTYEELMQLNLKDANGNVTEYKIPTLYETMKLCAGRIFVMLDYKIDIYATEDVYPISLAANALECHLYASFVSVAQMTGAEYQKQGNTWNTVYKWSMDYFDKNPTLKANMEAFYSYMSAGGKVRSRTWARLSETDANNEAPEIWEALRARGTNTLIYANFTIRFCRYISENYSADKTFS